MNNFDNNEYLQYQDNWENRSSIRTRKRKMIDFSNDGDFFAKLKQPIFLNETIDNLSIGIKKEILLKTFYNYLHEIIDLEIQLVNFVCNLIIYNTDLPVLYSENTKLNAYTILIDEYYHVYNAKDIIIQLDKKFPQLKNIVKTRSDSCNSVDIVLQNLDFKYHNIFKIIAVCVFETTLIHDLLDIFSTGDIHISVKEYINDHMNDEAKHAVFFANILKYTWQNLQQDYKENIGNQMGLFLKSYLSLNASKNFNINILNEVFDNHKIEEIISSIYDNFEISPDIPAVRSVLIALKNALLLEDSHVLNSLEAIGWKIKIKKDQT